jgi:hypothetical protein
MVDRLDALEPDLGLEPYDVDACTKAVRRLSAT